MGVAVSDEVVLGVVLGLVFREVIAATLSRATLRAMKSITCVSIVGFEQDDIESMNFQSAESANSHRRRRRSSFHMSCRSRTHKQTTFKNNKSIDGLNKTTWR